MKTLILLLLLVGFGLADTRTDSLWTNYTVTGDVPVEMKEFYMSASYPLSKDILDGIKIAHEAHIPVKLVLAQTAYERMPDQLLLDLSKLCDLYLNSTDRIVRNVLIVEKKGVTIKDDAEKVSRDSALVAFSFFMLHGALIK